MRSDLRTWIALASAVLLLASGPAAQKTDSAQARLRAAMDTAIVDGDLNGAIRQYQSIADTFKTDRAIVATALVHMAECCQKLGASESRKIYERVIREFPDQAQSATIARTRVAWLGGTASAQINQTARLIWRGVEQGEAPVESPSADGRYLLFATNDHGDLAIRDLNLGTVRRLTRNGGWIDQYADSSVLSPDGRRVAYGWWDYANEKTACCGYDLRILQVNGADGGRPRILHRSAETRYIKVFSWTPDLRSLLVVRQLQDRTYQIAFVSTDDGSVRVLKSLEWRRPEKVSLSPDGRSIAYDAPVSTEAPARDIFLLTPDEGRESVVARNPANDLQPIWSPDGSHLLFASNRTGSDALWPVRIDAGRPRGEAELIKREIGRLLGMTRTNALYYIAGGPTRNVHTVAVDATGTVTTTPSLATDRFVNSNTAPVWSPDGKSLAFYSARSRTNTDGSGMLVIRSLVTGGERDLQLDILPVGSLRWFPDGRSVLVVSRDQQRERTGYYRVNLATGKAELMFYGEMSRPSDMSPDGMSIFHIEQGGDHQPPQSLLMRYDVNSGRDTELKRGPNDGFRAVAVSPDGQRLAYFLSGRLEVIPVGGGVPHEVFRPGSDGPSRSVLAWTRDQRHLLFVTEGPDGANGGRIADLWRIGVSGGSPEKVGISVRGLLRFPAMHPNGRQITFQSVEDRPYELWALENFLSESGPARHRTPR